jgi:transcriptional regulator with PAS, ATPase and Fis domain
MIKQFYESLLNSIKDPILVADTNHIVQYMNKAAINHYEEGENLMGSNLLLCHNDESQKMMLDILGEMKDGLEEKQITDNDKHRIFMRAVRDENDELIGYFERYEPPQK